MSPARRVVALWSLLDHVGALPFDEDVAVDRVYARVLAALEREVIDYAEHLPLEPWDLAA
jgi:hypothetical protein